MLRKLGYPVVVALGFMLLGFIFLGVAWDGAASIDFVQGQIPYLLSGGAVGLGLIIVGAGMLLFESGRRASERLEARLDALQEAIMVGGVGGSNGAVSAESGTAAAAPAKGAVVIGRSSFHRQDCRLVAGKEDLTYASPDEAVARGLNACRVCDPAGTLSKKK